MTEFKSDPPKLSADEKLNLLVEFGARISSELRLDKLLDIIAQQITLVQNCTGPRPGTYRNTRAVKRQ